MGAPLGREADLPAYAQSLIRIKARQLTRRIGYSRSDEEDLRQELTTRLVQEWRRFDPGRGSLNTFIARVVDSTIAMILRDRLRQKHAAGLVTQSLDATVAVDQGQPISRTQILNEADHARRLGHEIRSESDQIEQAMAVNGVLATLPPNLRELCRSWVDGTETSIARDLGISRRQVRGLMERVRQRFEAAGLEKF